MFGTLRRFNIYCLIMFGDKERECEKLFDANGPFWHLYTDGSAVGDIFACDGLMKIGLTALAVWNSLVCLKDV